MIRLWVAICLVLVAAGSAFAVDWTPIDLGTSSDILDLMNGGWPFEWAVGQNGFAVESNGPKTIWTPVATGTGADLNSILEPVLGQVWVGGGHGAVQFLAFGTWNDRSIPNPNEDFHLYTRASYECAAVGTGGSIYRTTDGGLNWIQELSGTTTPLHSGAGWVYESNSWVVGDNGTILNSTDGMHWTPQVSGTTANLYDVIETTNLVMVVGANGTILKSTNAGATWSPRASGTTATLRAISTSYWAFMLAVGDGGTVVMSSDYGDTWCQVDSGTSANLYAVDALGSTEWFVGGAGGLLLHTTNAGGGCINPAGVGAPEPSAQTLVISDPQPFPARTEVRLRLQAKDPGTLEVGVFDLMGRRMPQTDLRSMQHGSERDLALDTHAWPNGMYWLRVQGDGVRTSRRVLVVR